MLSLSDYNQTDVIESFKSTSIYLDDLIMIIIFLKRLSLGSKDCTEEVKLECASFLGQTS